MVHRCCLWIESQRYATALRSNPVRVGEAWLDGFGLEDREEELVRRISAFFPFDAAEEKNDFEDIFGGIYRHIGRRHLL